MLTVFMNGGRVGFRICGAMQSSKDAHLLRFGIIRLVGGDLMNSLKV